MSQDYIPTEEEFEVILTALDHYSRTKAQADVATDEVVKAAKRLSEKVGKTSSEYEKAFDEAFGPNRGDALDGVTRLADDLAKEIDNTAIRARLLKVREDLTLLSAKMIRLRDQYRLATTDKAIRSLLNP